VSELIEIARADSGVLIEPLKKRIVELANPFDLKG